MTESAKRLVLIACILGTTVVTVDSTSVNVALPAISADLGGGLAGQQWVANAYLVTLGSLLLVGGSLGDILGERRVFMWGVGGFGVVSLLCALAPTIGLLIAGRALQGVMGALLSPAALAVIVATFPAEERGRAVGAWTAWGGIGTVLGPVVGGQLVDAASWRWIFAINVPVVLITLVVIMRAMPAGRERDPDARIDAVGAALCAFGLAGITFALIEQPMRGWGDVLVAGSLIGGVLLFAGFLVYERHTEAPMLPLELFSRRNFSVGNLETFAMYGGLSVVFFLLVVYLQQVAGYSALEAGSASLPVTVVMFLLSARFGRLADRAGPRLLMGAGPLIGASGILLMLRLDADVSYATDLLPALLLFALGLSMTVAPLTATVLADADEHNAGVASGVNNAIARVSGLIAIAAVGAIVAAHFAAGVDERLGPVGAAAVRDHPLTVPENGTPRIRAAAQEASISSFHVGIGIAGTLVALGGVLGLAGIRNPRREVAAAGCGGGQLVGVPEEASHQSPCDWHRSGDEQPVLTVPERSPA